MAFDSVSDFLAMGGYAPFVWSSYGLTVLLLGWVLLAPLFKRRTLERQLAQRQRRERGRQL